MTEAFGGVLRDQRHIRSTIVCDVDAATDATSSSSRITRAGQTTGSDDAEIAACKGTGPGTTPILVPAVN